jgi:hypothetical protein
MEEEKFTIAEFRRYIESCDSFGDVSHFLSAERIRKANEPKEENPDEESEDSDEDDTRWQNAKNRRYR